MTKITLEKLSKDGTLIVDASSYNYGTPLVSDTQIALREDSGKKVKKIIYTHATPAVQNRMFDFFGREYTVTTEGENLVIEIRNKITTEKITTEKIYDPSNVKQECGRRYRTQDSLLSFDMAGKFKIEDGYAKGDRAEGTTPEMIAGINSGYKEKVQLMFAGGQRHGLVEFLKQCGSEPAPGKLLVFALSQEEARARDRIGFYTTSPLEAIE